MLGTSAELEDLIESTVSIPTIPTTLVEINTVLSSPDSSARDAASVIERDPPIAAKVLRLANSSFYGLKNRVSAIPLACSILGFRIIKNIVVQAAVLKTFESVPGIERFDPNWLWDHSFKTAMAARMLAESASDLIGLQPEDAYTTGLVHDVGKLLLLEHQPERFGEAVLHSEKMQIPLAKAEAELFGFSHAHVGALLAQRWRLPEALQEGVMYHHSPGANPEQWAKGFLIHVANGIAHHNAKGDGGYRGDGIDTDAFGLLGIEPDRLDEIHAAVRSEGIDTDPD